METLHANATEFLKYLAVARKRPPNTIRACEYDLMHFSEYCRNLGIAPISADSGALQTYIDALFADFAPSSGMRHVSTLRMFYRYMLDQAQITSDPLVSVTVPRVTLVKKEALSIEVVLALLSAPMTGDPVLQCRDIAILELLYGSGLRITECTELNVASLNLQDRSVTVRTKGHPTRQIPFGTSALGALKAWLQVRTEILTDRSHGEHANPQRALFLGYRGTRLTGRSVNRMIEARCQKANLPVGVSAGRLRHACANHLHRAGADIRDIQELMGHARIYSTQQQMRTTKA